MKARSLLATGVVAIAVFGVMTPMATAAEQAIPSTRVCSEGTSSGPYACMAVAKRRVPSGDTAVFTGTLSAKALKNLGAWTKGDNIVCLTRYRTSPESDGGWPSTTLEGACTTVRKDGGFTIDAEFGRKGRFFYGLDMGPCRGEADLCGNGDPGLIGVLNQGNKALVLTTT